MLVSIQSTEFHPKVSSKLESSNWMNRFCELITDNISDPKLTNVRLAKEMGVSPRTLYSRIKLLTGMSPNHFIRAKRLELAYEILQKGECQTVKEVAYKIGFLKVEYFSKLFIKKYGFKPSNILKNIEV